MDAKSKASFINSVAAGQTIPCPKCNVANKPDSRFCISCGAEMSVLTAKNGDTVFSTVSNDSQPVIKKNEAYIEPVSVFAEGLPSWDVVPPQIMVRRR